MAPIIIWFRIRSMVSRSVMARREEGRIRMDERRFIFSPILPVKTKILLSKPRNERLRDEEVLRVKAFGEPEPDLAGALKELAALLHSPPQPRIAQVSEDSIQPFGFEAIPDGPVVFSHDSAVNNRCCSGKRPSLQGQDVVI